MKNKNIISIILPVIISFAFVAVVVRAATTISTNISTDGTLTVSDNTTLANASSTMLTVSNDVWLATLGGTVAIGTTTSPNVNLFIQSDEQTILRLLNTGNSGDANLDRAYVMIGSEHGNALLYLDAANGDGFGSDYMLIMHNNSDLSGSIFLQSGAGSFHISTGGWNEEAQRRLTVTQIGNVGIGTVNPVDKLSVVGDMSIYALGSDKVTNGNFGDDSSWTWGTGWAHDSTNLEADHSTNGTGALELDVSAVAGEEYQVAFRVKNRTTGSVTPQIGGTNGTAVSVNSTHGQRITATNTGNLKFTTTNTARLSIDDVSVKLITTGSNLKLTGLLTGGGSSGIKVTTSGLVGIGTSTPTVPLQVATSTANATTTIEVGKTGQNKGTCLKMYDVTGTVKYVSIQDGNFVISDTSCQ